MSKIIILIGVAGSGKSTWAFEYVKTNPNTVIVSRDSMRKSLFGYDDVNLKDYYLTEITQSENLISEFVDATVSTALKIGKDVIIDNTNLQTPYINHFKKFGEKIEIRFFDIDIEEIYKRDEIRIKAVGSNIIKKQYRYFSKLKNSNIAEEIAEYNDYLCKLKESAKWLEVNAFKEYCFVVDIDGTIAHTNGKRNNFEYHKVMQDTPDVQMHAIIKCLGGNFNIIYCTGREETCRSETKTWLEKYDFPCHGLYMRKKGDHRKDLFVKAEMLQKIQEDQNVICIFDDRNQVVDFERTLGYKVLQPINGAY